MGTLGLILGAIHTEHACGGGALVPHTCSLITQYRQRWWGTGVAILAAATQFAGSLHQWYMPYKSRCLCSWFLLMGRMIFNSILERTQKDKFTIWLKIFDRVSTRKTADNAFSRQICPIICLKSQVNAIMWRLKYNKIEKISSCYFKTIKIVMYVLTRRSSARDVK